MAGRPEGGVKERTVAILIHLPPNPIPQTLPTH